MSLREKEKAKEQQVKFQAILSALLKDEDNKYCIDCDAKGPRWASWNLGIFMCIRCAGIHRNLGVHISKVKSVNLDTWTAEQVAMMQEIGNSRGRAVYEANIPDGFRRPQSDSALEAFVRAKYEHKKYIAREWIPPTPKVPKEWLEDSKSEKKRRPKPAAGSQIQLGQVPKAGGSRPASGVSAASSAAPAQAKAAAKPAQVKLPPAKQEPPPSSASSDLLGLDFGQPQNGHQAAAPVPESGNELLDLFGGLQHGMAPAAAAAPTSNADLMNGASSVEKNLFEGEGAGEDKKATTKDSIMALFGGSGSTGGGGGAPQQQQQMYNIPGGMYMPQQGQQQQQAYPLMMNNMQQMQNNMGQQQGMMGQQQGMMGQQQGMMGQPQGMMGYQANMMPQQQQQGMMGAQQMNGQQMGMYNNQMMAGGQGQGMYTPQQMQQLQYQQMQQQMAAMNMGAPQQVSMPGGWGANNQGPGHTLSNNLWQ